MGCVMLFVLFFTLKDFDSAKGTCNGTLLAPVLVHNLLDSFGEKC